MRRRHAKTTRTILLAGGAVASLFITISAGAQVSGTQPPFAGTIEGFANLTFAAVAAPRGRAPDPPVNGRADIALRTFLRVETDNGFALGPRVVVQTLGQGPVELSD